MTDACAGFQCMYTVSPACGASLTPVEGFDLPAAVREARYAGGSVLTYVTLRDGTEVVASGTERMADAPEPGTTVYLHWNPAQAAVIGGASHGA